MFNNECFCLDAVLPIVLLSQEFELVSSLGSSGSLNDVDIKLLPELKTESADDSLHATGFTVITESSTWTELLFTALSTVKPAIFVSPASISAPT